MGKIVKSEKVVSKEVNGESILLDLTSGNYFSLNSTANLIWQSLSNHPERSELIATVKSMTLNAPADFEIEIEQTIADFCQLNLANEI